MSIRSTFIAILGAVSIGVLMAGCEYDADVDEAMRDRH